MLEKSMGVSALMIALVTGNVIWGGTAVRAYRAFGGTGTLNG